MPPHLSLFGSPLRQHVTVRLHKVQNEESDLFPGPFDYFGVSTLTIDQQ